MFDRHAQTLLRPVLNAAARGLVRAGISADALTWLGFAIGTAAAVAIANAKLSVNLAEGYGVITILSPKEVNLDE